MHYVLFVLAAAVFAANGGVPGWLACAAILGTAIISKNATGFGSSRFQEKKEG